MNIIKIQDQLKGVPDDALIGYVQNPTGQVPTYLALSELQRRKTMRNTYQQAQPAQTTVAEDLAAPPPMQQGAPTMPADQGVAGLPVPDDMYQDQNFAGGGIVAFDNGGDVSNYRQGQTALNLNLAGNPSENSKDGNPVNAVANLLGMARMGGFSPNMGMPGGVNGMGAGNPMGLLGLLGLGKQALQPRSYALNLNSGKQEAQYAGGGEVKHFEQGGTSRIGRWWEGYKQRGQESLAREDEIQRLQNEYNSLTISPFQKTLEGQPEAATKRQAEIKQRINELRAQKATSNIPSAAPSDKVLGSQAAEDASIRGSFGTSDTIPAYVPPAVDQQPPVVNPYAVDTSIPKPFSVEEAMKRQQEAMQMAGVDPDFYKKQAAELLEQREALKGERSDAANLALLKAGLATMGGTSPFALVNLGKGAEAGIEQYGKDIKDIRAENRLLKQADMKLKEAQNAQQRGDAQGALKAIQEREALIAQYNHYKMTTGATLEAARISAGTRTGVGQLPALYNALNKAQQAGNPTLVDQIQARIDDIEAGVTGGGGAIPAGVIVKKNK